MLLPLLEKAKEQSPNFLADPGTRRVPTGPSQCGTPFAPDASASPSVLSCPASSTAFIST